MTVAAPRPDAVPAASAASTERLPALDLLRGTVMLLMAIDHVRVYAGVPPGGPTLGLFLTRWVTHFCAPVFVFLAGTSAYLGGRRFATRPALARFLVGRGLLLVLLELTVLRFFWTFTVDYGDYLLGGVIWAIGWSMVALGGLVLLPAPLVAAVGVLIMAGHNLLDPHRAALTANLATASLGWLWQILYWGGELRIGEGGPRLVILYSLMPWIGVMAAGYGFGALLEGNPAARRGRCLTLGIGAIGVFLALRGFNLYGDPRPWQADGPLPAALAFLNTSKYPASLQFLLMTLGPALALLPLLERATGRLAGAVTTFGRVPMFYYLLHIPLIHLLALLVAGFRSGLGVDWLFAHHPMEPPPVPPGYQWSLTLLYLVTLAAVALPYPACRWYAEVKRRRPGGLRRFL